jgi:hypothetical protein
MNLKVSHRKITDYCLLADDFIIVLLWIPPNISEYLQIPPLLFGDNTKKAPKIK